MDAELFNTVDFISFDVKTPSTKVKTPWELLLEALSRYSQKIQIKAVVSDKKDFHFYEDCWEWLSSKAPKDLLKDIPFVITPNLSSKNFDHILSWNEATLAPFRVIGQQHKWVYGTGRLDI